MIIVIILNFLLNTEMISMIFMQVLKNTIQIRTENIDIIVNMLRNKKLELFIKGRKIIISHIFIT